MHGDQHEKHLRRIVRRAVVRDRGHSPLDRQLLGAYATARRATEVAGGEVDERAVDRVVRRLVARHPNPSGATRHEGERPLATRSVE